MRPDIDPALNYCPQCHDEYRADIRICASCGIELLGGGQILARRTTGGERHRPLRDLVPGDPLVAVRRGPVLQIKQLQAYLRDQGLPSLAVKDGEGGCGCRGGGELLLQVREADLEEVLAALAREYRQSTGLADHDTRFAGEVYDTQAAEAVCPACGCRFGTELTACPECGLCFV